MEHDASVSPKYFTNYNTAGNLQNSFWQKSAYPLNVFRTLCSKQLCYVFVQTHFTEKLQFQTIFNIVAYTYMILCGQID